MLYEKLKASQCSDIQGAWLYDFYEKNHDFLVTRKQKLGVMDHQALLEHSFDEIYIHILKQ